MNKTFFRMNFGSLKLALMIVVIAGAIAVIGLDIAMLAGAIVTAVPAVAWVSLAAAALVAVATVIILFGSGYRFEEERLVVLLGFFRDKLPYSEVTALKQNADSGALFVVLGSETEGMSVRIDVSPARKAAFEQELRKRVPEVPVQTFVLPKKSGKR